MDGNSSGRDGVMDLVAWVEDLLLDVEQYGYEWEKDALQELKRQLDIARRALQADLVRQSRLESFRCDSALSNVVALAEWRGREPLQTA